MLHAFVVFCYLCLRYLVVGACFHCPRTVWRLNLGPLTGDSLIVNCWRRFSSLMDESQDNTLSTRDMVVGNIHCFITRSIHECAVQTIRMYLPTSLNTSLTLTYTYILCAEQYVCQLLDCFWSRLFCESDIDT